MAKKEKAPPKKTDIYVDDPDTTIDPNVEIIMGRPLGPELEPEIEIGQVASVQIVADPQTGIVKDTRAAGDVYVVESGGEDELYGHRFRLIRPVREPQDNTPIGWSAVDLETGAERTFLHAHFDDMKKI